MLFAEIETDVETEEEEGNSQPHESKTKQSAQFYAWNSPSQTPRMKMGTKMVTGQKETKLYVLVFSFILVMIVFL